MANSALETGLATLEFSRKLTLGLLETIFLKINYVTSP